LDNTFDKVDDGYIFCGGRTNRDFETVLAAVRELNVPTKLAVGADVSLKGEIPKHVEIYREVSLKQFEELIGKARIIVITLSRPEIASGQIVLQQAMLCRKAVIITNTAGIDDYVSDGRNAILVKPHDPSDLSEKLKLLLADSNLRLELGKAAYVTAKEINNGNIFAEELTRLIIKDEN
jgi:glycosyltransferase involved in cell wall biosynthesis